MALQTIPGGLWLPEYRLATAANSIVIDASGEKMAFICEVPKTGTLDKFEFLPGSVTFNVASVLRFSFQDLSGGDPDGTQDQYRDVTSISANTWLAPGLMTHNGTDGGTKRSVTKGDLIACVIEFQTFNTSDSVQWQLFTLGEEPNVRSYASLFTASWAKQSRITTLALKYDDGTYERVINAAPYAATVTATTFNSGSTPDERGNLINVPFPFAACGAWFHGDIDNDADLVIYDAANSVLLSKTITAAVRSQTTPGSSYVEFAADVEFAANTNYRVVLKPGASSIALYSYTVPSAAHMNALPCGAKVIHTERTNAGSWTDESTRRSLIGLKVHKFDDGAGGGSGGSIVFAGSGRFGVRES